MQTFSSEDLIITNDLIDKINASPFLVIVISGGEPLLPHKSEDLVKLILGIEGKGIIVDTNGTNMLDKYLLQLLKEKNVLLRVSLDSVRPGSEICLRKIRGNKKRNEEIYFQKLNNIKSFVRDGVKVAAQSVLHKQNTLDIHHLPEKLQTWNIRLWFVQRLIPTVNMTESTYYTLDRDVYEALAHSLPNTSSKFNVRCITKKDRRHNCVFLMVHDGKIYTSSDNSEERIYLGQLGEISDYFSFVSSSEHSARYYSNDSLTE